MRGHTSDTAYSTGEAHHALTAAGHRLFIKPAQLRPTVPGGFTLDHSGIDTTNGTVTCPAGHTAPLSDLGGRHHQRKSHLREPVHRLPPARAVHQRARCTMERRPAGRRHHELGCR